MLRSRAVVVSQQTAKSFVALNITIGLADWEAIPEEISRTAEPVASRDEVASK